MEIIRLPKWDYRNLFLKINKDGNLHLEDSKRRTKWRQFLIKLINTIPINFIIGEGGIYYIIKGYNRAKNELETQPSKYVFSSFRPYADHYIAWLLKGKWKNAIWIADFRDLHVDPLYKHVLFPKLQQNLNAWILKRADKVLTVSEGLAKSLRKIHDNVVVMENPVHPYPVDSLIEKSEKFTISYTGSLYGNERDPSLLLKALSQLADHNRIDPLQFQFIYAGKDSRAMNEMFADAGLTDYFIDKGLVSRRESLNIQLKSHIHLLLTSSIPEMQGILTGKFLEYLGFYDPVITIINGTKDEIFEDLYERFEIGHLAYSDEKSLSGLLEYLEERLSLWENGENLIDLNKRAAIQKHFSWDGKIERLFDFTKTDEVS